MSATNDRMTKPGLGAGLLILRDGKVLLYRRVRPPEAGHWNIPGGKIDLYETGMDAAIRETFEETGLVVEKAAFLVLVEFIQPEEGQHWISLIYRALHFSGEAALREPDKLTAFGWFDLDALPAPLSHFAAEAIRAARTPS